MRKDLHKAMFPEPLIFIIFLPSPLPHAILQVQLIMEVVELKASHDPLGLQN